jgi:N-acetylglucosaminyldiphosphoundecaprenol N-acetyl-beta-D-mannosaminyltransferase
MSLSVVPTTFAPDHPAAVAGVQINLASVPVAVRELVRRAKSGSGFTAFTLNLDHVVKLRRDASFRAVYCRATYVTADGWPIVWLANRTGRRIRRTTGADVVAPICSAAARQALPVYFVGPGEDAQRGAIDVLRQRCPGLQIAGAHSPAVSIDASAAQIRALAKQIARSKARICFVSLGAPKQELIADALAIHCPDVGFICVGAALDFISGQSRRAPLWMRQSGLEWLWRLAGEPRRLVGRYAICAYIFLLLALGARTVPAEAYP